MRSSTVMGTGKTQSEAGCLNFNFLFPYFISPKCIPQRLTEPEEIMCINKIKISIFLSFCDTAKPIEKNYLRNIMGLCKKFLLPQGTDIWHFISFTFRIFTLKNVIGLCQMVV